MITIMILRRSWREKDSYQFLRCLARVGSSQDQRTMYQVLIIIISVASMVLIMIRDRVFQAKMTDNSKQTKTCEVAGPTGHTGVWSILGWISSRLIAVIRSERCAQPAITITINAWEIGGGLGISLWSQFTLHLAEIFRPGIAGCSCLYLCKSARVWERVFIVCLRLHFFSFFQGSSSH